LTYLFGVQQFTRYVGSGFNNAWPWWFYLPCMALLLFPWVFLALGEGAAQLRRRAPAPASALARPVLLLCWIWIAAITVFFSIPQSKLIGYILPVMPPLALLAAAGWGRWLDGRRAASAWLAALAVLMLVAMGVLTQVAARYTASRSSARDIAQALACAAAPDDPVYAVGGFPYDLPFYARMTHPLIAVQDWVRLRATENDTWKRELFEAGDFDPAMAARVLQSPPAALDAARAAPNAWVVANQGQDAALKNEGFRPVAQGKHWTLYASPAMPVERLAPEGPEAAQNKGQHGGGCGGYQPRQ